MVHVTPRRGFREQRRLKSLSETKPKPKGALKEKKGNPSLMTCPGSLAGFTASLGVSTCLAHPSAAAPS